jgi:hypothetical protein
VGVELRRVEGEREFLSAGIQQVGHDAQQSM